MSIDTSIGAHVTLIGEDEDFIIGSKYEDFPLVIHNEHHDGDERSYGVQKLWFGYLAHKKIDLPFIDVDKRTAEFADFEINGEQYSGIAVHFDRDGDANMDSEGIFGSIYGTPQRVVTEDFVAKIMHDLRYSAGTYILKHEIPT